MAETSKTFKREPTAREKWIKLLNERYEENRALAITALNCEELADLLKQNITPAKTIAYLMRVRMGKDTSQKGMTLNNEEIWMFRRIDIENIGENL